MNKIDLTEYSDNELSMVVFNDELLYRRRFTTGLVDSLRDYYKFTDIQLEVLQNDIKDDLEEFDDEVY